MMACFHYYSTKARNGAVLDVQGISLNLVSAFFGFLFPQRFVMDRRRRRCGNCGKAGAFLRRLFQAACGNHQEEVAEGFLVRFRFPQLRQFPQRGAARPRDRAVMHRPLACCIPTWIRSRSVRIAVSEKGKGTPRIGRIVVRGQPSDPQVAEASIFNVLKR